MSSIVATIFLAITLTTLTSSLAYASTLSLEPPPPPALFTNGTAVNLTADDKDRDISIDPYDSLPENGTQMIPTFQATDVDINEFPPMGVTVLIENDSIIVTNHTVWIGK